MHPRGAKQRESETTEIPIMQGPGIAGTIPPRRGGPACPPCGRPKLELAQWRAERRAWRRPRTLLAQSSWAGAPCHCLPSRQAVRGCVRCNVRLSRTRKQPGGRGPWPPKENFHPRRRLSTNQQKDHGCHGLSFTSVWTTRGGGAKSWVCQQESACSEGGLSPIGSMAVMLLSSGATGSPPKSPIFHAIAHGSL